MRTARRIIVLLSLFSLIALPTYARGNKPAPTEEGKYTAWKGEIDELEIIQPFKIAYFQKVVVMPFDISEVKLPEEKDNAYKPVRKVLDAAATPFTKGIADEMKNMRVATGEKSDADKTILVKVKVVEMDPGSKAARTWAGFGAGAARAKLNGEAIDAETGNVLFRFTQERRSGVGMMGGGYEDLMNRNLHQIGEDVAMILNSF